jgi:hypothetical protein
MEIKVVPFVPHVTDVNPANSAAAELQKAIDDMKSQGWEFVTLSSLQTTVKPTGCMKNNAQATVVNFQLLIFRR